MLCGQSHLISSLIHQNDRESRNYTICSDDDDNNDDYDNDTIISNDEKKIKRTIIDDYDNVNGDPCMRMYAYAYI